MNIEYLILGLFKSLGELSEREKRVLLFRFGVNDGISHTLEETGKEFGVTRERIRQIEAKALMRVKIFADNYAKLKACKCTIHKRNEHENCDTCCPKNKYGNRRHIDQEEATQKICITCLEKTGEIVPSPQQSNLERLIGKLNGGQFRLWDNEASVWWHSQWFSDNKMMTADGSTPTEAVENLIKELGK